MKNILIVVSIQSILVNLCFAYMPVYQVANQDLLKGILLGALLTTQRHPPHFLNVMPMPMQYSSNYVTQPTNYVYQNPGQNVMQGSDYRDQSSDQQQNQSQQQISVQQQESDNNSEEQQQTNHQQYQQQYQQQQQNRRQQEQQNQQQYQQQQEQNNQQQQQYQQQQRSESLYEPILTDPPSNPSNAKPIPSEPVIPSMESIQKNLGINSHSVILMILPPIDENKPNKSKNITETQTEQTDEERDSSEQQLINSYNNENTIKTNAIKVGTTHLNSKGWKPVPKAATITTTTTEPYFDHNRFNRFNYKKYIERSQFGLRNKDLNAYYD